MNQQPEQRVIYLCDVNRNVKCTKEGCVINGGPCCSTSEIDNSWRDINGDPIISTEEIQDWVLAEIVDPPIRERYLLFPTTVVPQNGNSAHAIF